MDIIGPNEVAVSTATWASFRDQSFIFSKAFRQLFSLALFCIYCLFLTDSLCDDYV
jgi:hypothetical protein